MRKRLLIILALVGVAFFLSGCTQINEPISPDSEGIWNSYFVWPLSLLITYIAETIFNHGYGLAIIIVTLLLRTIILPLNIKQLKSSQAMQLLQPEIQKLREKYSSKDQQTQQKLQQETMALFQKHGVNPLAGCLPILVQMPILIAFYHAIMRTPEIKEYGFLWFQLGDPSIILALITMATTYIQQKIMMAGTTAGANPQMQIMLYLLPIMIGGFALFFPSALALYWVVGNLFMIAQTIFIRRPMMKEFENNNGGAKK
ncbi:YidC family membrane integrase SpoIIIJ [Tenuibacillus multivorans]|uniref:Membrane protein insertase YidC n=1 Tax=Tenuibacillus multivorans TaxID=237069 RepID=A0A1G9W652_9BACI|nr:YidC family membrane integrase SpoIIIJ [Tenuibacillus multivorans]GEL76325.1 membrane protein insertase MisCA [Tenuibacillus multivorans]SDM79940.1 YidC/Oxa1 family membrane protein insertase [Tenuibacillus multivorans]